MPDVAPNSDLERLCLACGLCCDGSLFERIEVLPSDLTRLGHRAPVTAPSPPADRLPQPCEYLGRSSSSGASACVCKVYAQRPACCASFRCGLLESLSRRERDYQECARLVEDARGRARHLRESLDLPLDAPLWTAIAKHLGDLGALDDAASRRRHAEALMDAAELRALCARVFGTIRAARESL